MDPWARVRQRIDSMVGRYDDVEFVINGHRLTPLQIEQFKRLTGSFFVEPGRYWLDPASGAMGVEGSPLPVFNIYGHAMRQAGSAGSSGPSLSERRMLFNSFDLTGLWRDGD